MKREEMLMAIANVVAARSTCSRMAVGAVIAREGRVMSSGYNGTLVGMPHCEHLWNDPCTEAIHAEANAILFAARYGVGTEGAELYTTHQPCIACARMIVNAGITQLVYQYPYRNNEGLELLLSTPSVEVFQLQLDGSLTNLTRSSVTTTKEE